ncbi:MAG: spondin domain-containing protein [Burkholderiales bacterium]|nr:spondin domain-containing protein [Burkholderiales bacterium]
MSIPPPAITRRLALCALAAAAVSAQATEPHGRWLYEVSVTNITYNQRFTPLLLATHKPEIRFFTLGQPAVPELATLAEEGNVAPLRALLDASALVTATAAASGLLDPGKTATFQIQGNPWRDRLSVAAMLIPTNDAFVALNGVPLPLPHQGAQTFTALAYDAGSEVNDELCSSIPGPFFAECGGPGGGARVGGGEGFVHVHRGVHGVGSLQPNQRDWRNPVASIRVRLVR